MTVKQIHIEKYDFDAFEKEQKPFTMMRTEIIQKIPAKHAQEFLLWVYLESLPETWKPNKAHLTARFNISDRTYERYMAWLNSVGLIEYQQERKNRGTFGKGRLLVLNGSRFSLEAALSGTVNIGGSAVNKRKKPKLSTEKSKTERTKLSARDKESEDPDPPTNSANSPNRQITDTRLNDVHIKTIKRNRKEERKTNTPSVSVFIDKETIKKHLNLTIANREIFVEEEIIEQIVFYVGKDLTYDEVIKKINIALKKVREGKWNIPHGYKGLTSTSIREQEEEHELKKRRQYEQESQVFRKITKAVSSGAAYVSIAERVSKLRDDLDAKKGAMPEKDISNRHKIWC